MLIGQTPNSPQIRRGQCCGHSTGVCQHCRRNEELDHDLLNHIVFRCRREKCSHDNSKNGSRKNHGITIGISSQKKQIMESITSLAEIHPHHDVTDQQKPNSGELSTNISEIGLIQFQQTDVSHLSRFSASVDEKFGSEQCRDCHVCPRDQSGGEGCQESWSVVAIEGVGDGRYGVGEGEKAGSQGGAGEKGGGREEGSFGWLGREYGGGSVAVLVWLLYRFVFNVAKQLRDFTVSVFSGRNNSRFVDFSHFI
mmetsp:Transcript_4141/g.8810  ORF Transcript_4141/g.8810 Transcript_4141/m.8810 type:complete len:253 (-) Transcript_4141:300-1058(-)